MTKKQVFDKIDTILCSLTKIGVQFASLTKILFYKYNFILTKFFFKLNNLLYCEFRLS